VIVVLFLFFAFTSFCSDALGALNVDLHTSGFFTARALLAFGEACDPLLLENPLWLRFMLGVSAFVFGPMNLAIAYGLWAGKPWVRELSIVYATAILYSMIVYGGTELFGPLPPTNLALWLTANGPYAAAPAWLLVHMLRHRDPFAAATRSGGHSRRRAGV
jgi:hypothetical protein